MSKLALELIQENLEQHARGEASGYLELGRCGLRDEDFEPGRRLEKMLRQCTHLHTLILSNEWSGEIEIIRSRNLGMKNKLNKIPCCIEALIRLNMLVCGGSKSEKWEIQKIEHLSGLYLLEVLNLSNNQISEINGLESFTKLKDLNLEGNEIRKVKGLELNYGLEKLNLGHNKITNIEELESLNCLKKIDVEYNKIIKINSLEILSELSYINLKNNQIKDIKPLLLFFEKGLDIKSILLDNNPIKNPPEEIWRQGRKAIIEYFRLIEQEGGTQPIYEAKLTLVGEGGAGKTSLQARILDPLAELPGAEIRTRGVEISDWNISQTFDKKEIVHIWDFGGQDMYFPVHRFFLTENCVYVLVATSRSQAHNFDYWVPSIYQFGGDSPILIVQTMHDGHHEPWQAALAAFYQNPDFCIIRTNAEGYFRLNLKDRDNIGLEEIKSVISTQIRGLKNFGTGVPPSFITMRNALLDVKEQNPCMSFADFKAFCVRINKEFKREETLNLFTGTMHEIGALLWFRNDDELRNWVILKPDWAMQAVYRLIDDDEIEVHNGHIRRQDFDRLWPDSHYEGRHHVLKTMLKVFKIAFSKRNKEHEYILPAKQLRAPSLEGWVLRPEQLRLWVKFSFMPKGLINQVSAGLSSNIVLDEDVWNSGVILNDVAHNSQCLVTENTGEKKINIIARGMDARHLSRTVLDMLGEIVSDYRGVTYEVIVPCRCGKCTKNENPKTQYEYKILLKWLNENPDKILWCNDGEEQYRADWLLQQSGLPKADTQRDKHGKGEDKERDTEKTSFIINQNFELKQTQKNKQKNKQKVIIEKIDFSNNTDMQELKQSLEELQTAATDNKEWQDALIGVMSEISAIENAGDKAEQQNKLLNIKKIWEPFKVAKDFKGVVEFFPWAAKIIHHIPDLIKGIEHWLHK